MMNVSSQLKAVLDTVPTKPGCYLMKDGGGKVIYVGKAINLRNRVRSYFHNSAQHHPRTQKLVAKIADIEWIVVDSELEALILEMNLIKKYRPHYNVRLKDDKRYPYIKVHWEDPFPKVTVTRRMLQDGSRYFGPYTSVWAVHQTLDVLRRIFPYLTCDRVITGRDKRACLYYDIKLCTAPCIGVIDQDNYRQMIDDLCQFLMGRTEPIVSRLHIQMEKAAEDLKYEQAATIRDQLQAIEKVVERQKVVSSDYIDSDVIAMARSNGEACVQVFFIRSGKLIGREYFLLEGTEETPDAGVMGEFIKQFYDQAPNVPPQVLLPHEVEEAQIIRQWLRQRSQDNKVEILVPRQGQQQELIQMAAENAAETLAALQAQWEADRHRQTQALNELQEALNLSMPPNRIECYDISNTQGTAAVGSMVVFEQGVPKKKHYRHFNIRSVVGPDDFASMQEVLTRRFNRWKVDQDAKKTPGKKTDQSFGLLPDLLLVDGGKGQLSRAITVLEDFGFQGKIPVAGLAKENEELFIPGQPTSIILPRHSQGLYLIQRIRDEAHRFAITSHRRLRTKKGLASRLDAIPGIGPARRKLLLNHFGSIYDIQQATLEELTAVPGISPKLAKEIKSHLE
ncbi:MAG: excinuclease ABC subunit UvrC [Anaerolineales bacterium]|nr:excinuclease ABC subunit UvrC [Anaerolineales bacterium]MCK5314032.1 excinuclease ABC subunit UvrC [Anaerolineales bacterium]